jgi:hypothetical protein
MSVFVILISKLHKHKAVGKGGKGEGEGGEEGRKAYPIIRLDVELDLLACQGSYSMLLSAPVANGQGREGMGVT